jgi:hypothetical protein
MEYEEEEKARIHGIGLDETTTNNLRALAQDLDLTQATFENILVESTSAW